MSANTRRTAKNRANEKTPATLVIPEVNYCPICGKYLEEIPERHRGHIFGTYCDSCKNRATIWIIH